MASEADLFIDGPPAVDERLRLALDGLLGREARIARADPGETLIGDQGIGQALDLELDIRLVPRTNRRTCFPT